MRLTKINPIKQKLGDLMPKHKHVINLSEVAVDKINPPEGSPFGV
jgi:hypothetical protein